MALFDVQNIGFAQNGKTIVDGVSLSIEKGSVTGFLGKSGCGKTTLIKLISGILVPTTGKSFFEGNDIQSMNKAQNLDFRRRCTLGKPGYHAESDSAFENPFSENAS